MRLLSVGLRYRVNVHLPVHAEDVLDSYLSSFSHFSDTHLRSLPLRTIDEWVAASFLTLEQKLVTLFFLQAYRDTTQYRRSDTRGRIQINVKFPVVYTRRVSIRIGTQDPFYTHDFPDDVIGYKSDSGRFRTPIRRINFVPYVFGSLKGFGGFFGLGAYGTIYAGGDYDQPNFWESYYLTGYKEIPEDVRDYIKLDVAKRAVIAIGDIVFGPGVSGYTLSTEGLSQSVSSSGGSEGGGVFAGTVKGWTKILDMKMKDLCRAYLGTRVMN